MHGNGRRRPSMSKPHARPASQSKRNSACSIQATTFRDAGRRFHGKGRTSTGIAWRHCRHPDQTSRLDNFLSPVSFLLHLLHLFGISGYLHLLHCRRRHWIPIRYHYQYRHRHLHCMRFPPLFPSTIHRHGPLQSSAGRWAAAEADEDVYRHQELL